MSVFAFTFSLAKTEFFIIVIIIIFLMSTPSLQVNLFLPNRKVKWKALPKLKKENQNLICKVMTNKQHQWRELLSSFHLNGHTSTFLPQTQNLEPPL